jgi:hypothetical protein
MEEHIVALALPAWFQDNFVDIESMLIDLFGRIVPSVDVGCWYADDWLDDPTPDPQLLFFRLPGSRVDYEKNSDICHVQVVALTPSRDDSWRLMNFVRAVLLPMQGFKIKMEDGYTANVWCTDDIAGPQLLTPGQQIDTRVITAVFSLRVGLRSRKRYDQIIAGL